MYASLLVGLAVTISAPAPKDAPKKESSIVGEWNGVKAVAAGKELPVPEGGVTFTFAEDGKVLIREGKRDKDSATYKVDPRKDPPELDLIPPPDKKEPTVHGIFKVEGDTLTLCFERGQGEGTRPTKFESPEGSRIIVITLQRAKK